MERIENITTEDLWNAEMCLSNQLTLSRMAAHRGETKEIVSHLTEIMRQMSMLCAKACRAHKKVCESICTSSIAKIGIVEQLQWWETQIAQQEKALSDPDEERYLEKKSIDIDLEKMLAVHRTLLQVRQLVG